MYPHKNILLKWPSVLTWISRKQSTLRSILIQENVIQLETITEFIFTVSIRSWCIFTLICWPFCLWAYSACVHVLSLTYVQLSQVHLEPKILPTWSNWFHDVHPVSLCGLKLYQLCYLGLLACTFGAQNTFNNKHMIGFWSEQFLPCDTLYCMSYVGQLLEENIAKES